MRIGMAIPAFLPARAYGGPIEVVLRLAEGLRREDVEIQVLTSTLDAPGHAGFEAGPGREDGLEVLRMPTRWSMRWSPWVDWRAPTPPPDVVHIFGVWNGLSYSAARWASKVGVPWIWEPSGMLPTRGRHQWIKRTVTPWHLRLAQRAAGVIWTSPQERIEAPAGFAGVRHWLRANPPPTELPRELPTAEEARRKLGLPLDGPLWGYLGRIDDRKGIPELLQAWREARGPGTLVFAGPTGLQPIADDIARTDGVVRLDTLDADERWVYLRALDSLVLAPKFGENFAIVVLEAIAVGTPALCSPAVGAQYWLESAGAVKVTGGHAEWVQRFKDGALPPAATPLPESIDNDGIARQQIGIYRDAIEETPSKH